MVGLDVLRADALRENEGCEDLAEIFPAKQGSHTGDDRNGNRMKNRRWTGMDVISDILIRSENDLAQFAVTATSMNGAFFLVSGFRSQASWPDGAKPISDR